MILTAVTCFHPLRAWRGKPREDGKQNIVFKPGEALNPHNELELPCGQCIGCRLEKSRQWALRCVHEASLHDENCFLTLTYSDEHLPEDNSLDVRTFQLFMKRLRKRFSDRRIRFYHCGEYGEKTGRPHYHALIFGLEFPDKTLWKESPQGYHTYRSKILEQLWPFGFSTIGAVTWQSAAYTARYIMKKQNGEIADAWYTYIDPITGEVFQLKPEYTTMSRRPGIGKDWFNKYASDLFPHDYAVHDGKTLRVPRYYDEMYKEHDADEFEKIKKKRKRKALKNKDDQTPERRKTRQIVLNHKVNRLKRDLQ